MDNLIICFIVFLLSAGLDSLKRIQDAVRHYKARVNTLHSVVLSDGKPIHIPESELELQLTGFAL
jgi:hypothetical protein